MVGITTHSMVSGAILTMAMDIIILTGEVDLVGGMDGMVFTLHFIITILLTTMAMEIIIDHITTTYPITVEEETVTTVDELLQEAELLTQQEDALL